MEKLISVCIIVKNEEKVIRRCLESIYGIPDEIVIVDTGSTDRTKEIALEYSNLVFDYVWEHDFSKARNFAADRATGKWILAIDADEFVDRDSFSNFIRNFREQTPQANILAVQIVNFVGTRGQSTVLNYHERLYINNGTIRYYRSIHEMLKHKDGLEKKGISELQIFHSGYMEDVVKNKNKSERNLTLLKNKKNKEPIDYFFLGNEYYQLKDYDRAIQYYKKAYQQKENISHDWVLKLLVRLTNCLTAIGRSKEALEVINSSIEVFPEIVDYQFLKGQIYAELDKTEDAIVIFENIIRNKDQLKADSSTDYLEYLPHKYLGELYEKKANLSLAVKHYSKALTINESDDITWIKLLTLLGKHSSYEELVEFVKNNCLNRKNMNANRMTSILLRVMNLNAQKVSRALINLPSLSPIERDGVILKNLLLDKEFGEVKDILGKSTLPQISNLLSAGTFTLVDLILLTLVTNDEELLKFLYNLNYEESIQNLLDVLFNNNKNKKLSVLEEQIIVSLFKQARVLDLVNILGMFKSKKIPLSRDSRLVLKKK